MGEKPKTDSTLPAFVPVCAIGASAGGVAALQTLFRLLPDDLGLAYVVVMHLAPDHPSAMDEILGSVTRMPVMQVEDGPTLHPNCVYMIAPDRELVIEGDDVKSRPFTDPRGRRAPIDMFFRSIASGRGDGIAVVLTGAGSDGAVGVRAIKEAGGIVMVQEPAEAGFPSMPQNAIATGVADVVAPLARLAERIAEAARSKEAVRSLDEDGDANHVRRIIAFLRTRTGHDFSGYKRATVLRRIARRMQVCQIDSLPEYARHLRETPEEAKALFADLLISVTMFFRDPETFVALGHRVIQPMFERRATDEDAAEIRAWVVGCATGEEAYSLAILLLEEAERQSLHLPIQIFATDLDEGALATAREGRYPRSIEADVSAERLKRFFVDEETHYRIAGRVRDMVLFATHSVVREPPFMRLDLVTCRNVLIYLERALQQHVCGIFHYGLKPEGYLFLGTAETADAAKNQFAVIDREARIYRAMPAGPEFLPSLISAAPMHAARAVLNESRPAPTRFDAGEVLGASHAAALEENAPPSALVDAEHGVLHLSPTAGRFVQLSAGPLSSRLPSIVRPELRLDLKLALDRVFEAREPTITRLIDVQLDGEARRVSLHIAPVPTGEGAAARAIVYFLDNGPGRPSDDEEAPPPPDELRHLHSELKVAQESEPAGRLRHESAVQELRASNEELQSLNEEYRSTAEELETSKEELQSINEELQTVNAELKSKLATISAAHNDLQNLTASSEIGTLFLDLDLRIRMFTPPVADLINLTQADVGRPITDFTHRLDYEGLEGDVRAVLRDQQPIDAEIATRDGGCFLMRIRPYRTLEGAVEGVVVTFDDITDRKRGELALRESEEKFRALIVASNNTLYRMSADWRLMYELDSDTLADTPEPSESWRDDYILADDRPLVEPAIAEAICTKSTFELEHRVLLADRSIGWVLSRAVPVIGADGEIVEWFGAASDVTERRRAIEALAESEEKYRALFEAMVEGFYFARAIFDEQGKCVDLLYLDENPAAVRMIGQSAKGRLLSELGPYEQHWRDVFGHTAKTGEPQKMVQFAEHDGIWYDFHVFKPASAGENEFAVVFNDATARHEAEMALRDSEAKYRSLFETMTEGFGICELVRDSTGRAIDWRFLELNPALEKQTGMDLAASVGPLFSELFPGADRSYWLGVYQEVVDTQSARAFEDYWPPIGRWLAGTAAPAGGERFTILYADITDRKRTEAALRESEQWLQTLMRGLPQLVWRAVDGGRWTWASPQWTDFTGQSEGDSHDRGWLDPVHPDDRQGVLDAWAGAVERGEFHADYRLCEAAAGRYRWFQTRATPVRDEAGAIVEWLGTSTDVDDLRALQDRQDVLLAELQHRVRNVLSVTRSIISRSDDGQRSTEDYVQHLQGRIGALARTQVLLTRAAGGEVDLESLVRDELLAQAVADDQVSLDGVDVALSPKTAEVLTLALHELATNATKYGAFSRPGGRLDVRWRVEARDGHDWLVFDWKESGVPIVDAAPRHRGFGAELISRRIPYELKGHGSLELKPGGAESHIEFPLTDGDSILQTDTRV